MTSSSDNSVQEHNNPPSGQDLCVLYFDIWSSSGQSWTITCRPDQRKLHAYKLYGQSRMSTSMFKLIRKGVITSTGQRVTAEWTLLTAEVMRVVQSVSVHQKVKWSVGWSVLVSVLSVTLWSGV